MVSNAEEIPRLCPSRARRRPARSRGECPARQRAGCTRFPSTAVDRSVVFDVYLLVSGIAQAIAAFTVGVSPGSRVWLFISGAVSVALGYFAFRDFKQRRRRVDAGHMDRRWIHIPRCHGDRIGDRCSSTARAGLVRVRQDPHCDGVVTLVWPISSIVALAIIAGAWLVVVGITEVVWALSARRTVKKGERRIEESLAPSAAS